MGEENRILVGCQFGFTDRVSCNIAAMLLTESILGCKDLNLAIYMTYLAAWIKSLRCRES